MAPRRRRNRSRSRSRASATEPLRSPSNSPASKGRSSSHASTSNASSTLARGSTQHSTQDGVSANIANNSADDDLDDDDQHSSSDQPSGDDRIQLRRTDALQRRLQAERDIARRQILHDTVQSAFQNVTTTCLIFWLYQALEPFLQLASLSFRLLWRVRFLLAFPCFLLLVGFVSFGTANHCCETYKPIRIASNLITWLGGPDICAFVNLPFGSPNSAPSRVLAHGLEKTEEILVKLVNKESRVENSIRAFRKIHDLTSSVTNYLQDGTGEFQNRAALLSSLDEISSSGRATSEVMTAFNDEEEIFRNTMIYEIELLDKTGLATVETEMGRSILRACLENALSYIAPNFFIEVSNTGRFISTYIGFLRRAKQSSMELAQRADDVVTPLNRLEAELHRALALIQGEQRQRSQRCQQSTYTYTRFGVFTGSSISPQPLICFEDGQKQVKNLEVLLSIVQWLLRTTLDVYYEHQDVQKNLDRVDNWVKRRLTAAEASSSIGAPGPSLEADDASVVDLYSDRKNLLAIVADLRSLSDHVKKGRLLRDERNKLETRDRGSRPP